MHSRRTPLIGAVALLALAASATGAAAVPTLTNFTSGVVGGGKPQNITAGPDGNLWFTYAASSGRVARITTAGTVTDLASAIPDNVGPYDIAAGPDGKVWFTENTAGRIGRLTPAGEYTEFSAGLSGGSGPTGITAGPDGNMWFTLQNGPGAIGRITPDGVITLFTAGLSGGMGPTDITGGPDGNLWFTLRGNLISTPAIGRITPAGVITQFSSGLSYASSPEQITTGPDGNLWFTLYTGNAIGRITPAGVITRFSSGLPSNSGPTGIAQGGDGKLWFTLRNRDSIGSVTTAGAISVLSPDLGSGVEPTGIARGPEGNLWFVSRTAPARVWRLGVMPPTVGAGTAYTNSPGDQTVTVPVNAMGQTTSYVLRYGTTSDYGQFAAGVIGATSSAWQSVSVRLTGLTPGVAYSYRLTATNGSGSATGPNGTFTAGVSDPGATPPPPDDTDQDRPELGSSVVVAPVSGRVMVRPPGLERALPLPSSGGQLPVGTEIDTRAGTVDLSSALPGGRSQTGRFWGGRFTVTQSRSKAARGMTTLALPSAPLPGCPGPRLYAPPPVLTPMAGASAFETARKRKPRRTLWGKDHGGRFRTQGHNSVATVRGTRWATIDTCDGTITRVVRGAVAVRDIHARRTVIVRAGKQYLARTPK